MQDPIAIRYNDTSVLENFHAAEGFALMANPRFNIFTGMTPEARSSARYTIIQTVLATDLAQGQKYVSAFKAKSAVDNIGTSNGERRELTALLSCSHAITRRPLAVAAAARCCCRYVQRTSCSSCR